MIGSYDKIRFIGYAIPTTPGNLVSIGDPNGPGAVAGTYFGSTDTEIDLSSRIGIMKNAVDSAKERLPENENDVVNVFLVPEFYFHGPKGPYIFNDPSQDPVLSLKQKLAENFDATNYPDWTFVCGSTITAFIKNEERLFNSTESTTRNSIVDNMARQWQSAYGPLKGVIFDMLVNFIKNCHSYPVCEVRNRSIVVSNIPIRIPAEDRPTNCMITEKYYASNEDFLLYDVSGKQVITEQMIAYPPIDLSGGDNKEDNFDQYAIFRQNKINPENPIGTTVTDYGIEICLDHSDTRLRRNIDNLQWPVLGIHIQLIPSCGMQIKQASVATDKNGFVFNCDGQYSLNAHQYGQEVINGVDCLYANYVCEDDKKYAAHTQLTRVDSPALGGNPNSPQAKNATFTQLSLDNINTISVPTPTDLKHFFAGGAGEVHIYGKSKPFVLYP